MSIVMQINPFDFFVDGAGTALDAGYIYIGQPNLDPRQYPVQIFYDEALTVAAAQPLRTSHGYVYRAGAPTFLYINGNYSVMVQDKNHVQVYYVADALLIGNGSAVSKAELAADNGAELVGYKAPGTNTAKRDVYKKIQREIELGDYLAGGSDDTVQFKNLAADIPNKTVSRMVSIGGLQASFTGTTPRVIVRAGDYSLSDSITWPSYLNLEGEECFITQNGGITKDIFTGVHYLWTIQGFNFVGGRNQISFHNNNINSSMVEISNCDFMLSDGFAVNTFATGTDGGGNAWSHLSTEANLHKVRILSCKQGINNACDHMAISNSWFQPNKTNLTPSTAYIINKGTSASDPDALTRMHIKDTFLIPDVGTQGIDRVENFRWVDNYGSFKASDSRFGGESGGAQIVAHLGAPNTAFPWNSTEVVFVGCMLFAGPEARIDSCVLAIQGQVPNRFTIQNCTGPLGKPLIANLSSTDFPTYFANFEAASGKKAIEYFKIDIQSDMYDLNAYTPLRPLMPATLLPYTIKGRSTKIRRAGQSIPTGLALANPISFDTIVEDNLNTFDITQPTRLTMKNGCSKMMINASLVMASDGAAKLISMDLVDSGGTTVDSLTGQRPASPESDRIKAVFEVSGPPGSFWQLRVRHNAAGPLVATDCQVKITPTDHMV